MERLLERVVESAGGQSRWRHAAAEIAVMHEASRCLTYHALRLFAAGQDALREVTEAKLISQRAAFEAAELAFRITAETRRSAAPCATPASGRSAEAPTR
jgi:acyl-CoA dehydrogenase